MESNEPPKSPVAAAATAAKKKNKKNKKKTAKPEAEQPESQDTPLDVKVEGGELPLVADKNTTMAQVQKLAEALYGVRMTEEDEFKPKAHKFWDTQPVPKMGELLFIHLRGCAMSCAWLLSQTLCFSWGFLKQAAVSE